MDFKVIYHDFFSQRRAMIGQSTEVDDNQVKVIVAKNCNIIVREVAKCLLVSHRTFKFIWISQKPYIQLHHEWKGIYLAQKINF